MDFSGIIFAWFSAKGEKLLMELYFPSAALLINAMSEAKKCVFASLAFSEEMCNDSDLKCIT